MFSLVLESVFYHFKRNVEKPYHHVGLFSLTHLCCNCLLLHLHILEAVLQSVIILAFKCQTYFKEFKRRIVNYIYSDIYYFCCSSIIPCVPFPLTKELRLAVLLELATNLTVSQLRMFFYFTFTP